jgi:putative FmdB family regulatory protein
VPTYQYACTECGEQLEKVQKFSDDPLTVCPNCNGRLRKVFSPVGIVFKGSGFYRTDSRSGPVAGGKDGKDSAGQDNGKDGKVKADSGSKSEGSASKSENSGDKSDKSSVKSDSSGTSSSKDSSSSSSSSGKSSGSTSEKVA